MNVLYEEKKMDNQYMEIRFELFKLNSYDLNDIVRCILDLNNIIGADYNKVEFYFSKDYWRNGWLKSDIIKKYKSKQVSDIQIDYLCLKDCNSVLLELKLNKKIVLDISFAPKYNSDLNVYGFSLSIYRIGELYAEDLILKLASSIKEYFYAKDDIKLINDQNPLINGAKSIIVNFKNFDYGKR